LGELLLVDAIRRVLNVTQSVAAKFLIVDSKNEKAKAFYLRYGFQPFGENQRSLVIAIDTFKGLFKR
jgi:ribosomal protein S18 acetylase RimI-like enzyme